MYKDEVNILALDLFRVASSDGNDDGEGVGADGGGNTDYRRFFGSQCSL